MTISIEPTDFGQDILDSISPLLGAFGLLGSDGKLDINNWSLEKALGVFGTYERTEFILNLLSGYISSPTSVYREVDTGLISKPGLLPPDKLQEDEWFSISKGNGWSVHIVVNHQKNGALPNGEHAHQIELGIGVKVDDLNFSLSSGNLLLNGHLCVPILRIKNKESGGNYVVNDSIPELDYERLIWDPRGSYLSRIALSAILSPETGRFGAQAPSAEAIALNCAFGQPHEDENTSIVAKIALLDFIAQQNGLPSTLEVDIVDAVNGGMAGVLENLVPAMMEMLPDDAQSFAENLLPMLGLLDSDWSATGGSAMSWPRLAIIDLIDDLQNDSDQAWNRVRAWLLELTHPEVATQWLTHLYSLIFPNSPPPGLVGGSCTQADPAFVKFLDLPGMSGELLIALWEDVAGDKRLDVGVKFSADKTLGNAIDVEGGLTAWIATIPITGGGSIAFFSEFIGDFLLEGVGGTDLMDETVGGGETGSPLDNLHVRLGKARLGVAIQRNGDVEPLIEMLDVDIGSSPVNHYPVIDLTSSSSVMDAIGGVLDTLLDTVSDALAENDVLQWLGSLVGLVAPRDGNFRTDWEGAGTAGDLRIDILRLIQNPKDEITDYYARLLETDIDPYGQGSMKAWVYIQEALVLLINTALSGPMKIEKPGMPSNQPIVLGDGTPSSPWRTIIGDGESIPGFNIFSFVEPTETLGVNRLSLGIGSLISIIQLKEDLHLEANVDLCIISFDLSEVSVSDVPANATLISSIKCGLKLHDAITNLGDANNGVGKQISLPSFGDLMFTIDAFSLDFGWMSGDGFGVKFTIHSPRIGSVVPDFTHLQSQLQSVKELRKFNWSKGRLNGPHGSVSPDLGSFEDISSVDFDSPMPTNINFETDDGIQLSAIVNWQFNGLACPEFGFDTRIGLFGLIDSTGTQNCFIDLDSNQSIISNEGVQMIIGQILAHKGGRVGFMISLLLGVDPHLLFTELEDYIEDDIEYVGIESLNWHPDWLSSYPRRNGAYGLGIFSLPYDWPCINWPDFCSTPFLELNRWFVEVVKNSSFSGEPFVLPLLRWIYGLMSNLTPDLSQWDLGWHSEVNAVTGRVQIQEPQLPYDVRGQGTYEQPWKVMIGSTPNTSIDLIIWMGPEGPTNFIPGPHVYSAVGSERLFLLEDEVNEIDPVSLNYEFPNDWHYKCADILIRLSEYSERTKSAVGGLSRQRLSKLLMTFDQLMKTSDGFSSLESQTGAFSTSIETSSNVSVSPRHSSPHGEKVLDECESAILEWLPSDWDPETGNSASGKYTLLLLSSSESSLYSELWTPLIQRIKSVHSIQDINSVLSFDWSNLSQSTGASIPSAYQNSQGIVSVNLSSSNELNGNSEPTPVMINQIQLLIQKYSSNGTKCLIIAHSKSGVEVNQMINSNSISEHDVCGLLTINSPHHGTLENSVERRDINEMLHYLSTLVTVTNHQSLSITRKPEGIMDIEELNSILQDMREGF